MAKNLTVSQRDQSIYLIISEYLNTKSQSIKFDNPFLYEEVESLFSTNIWGHREIVLTILMARLLNPAYKASESFYSCNPRSLFENPIRKALREHAIPHRKSGPLNVAKNIKKINLDWASDKHESSVAKNVVKIVEKIESVSINDLKKFAAAYISRYKEEAKKVKELEINLPSQENPIFITKLCTDLINTVPDGGATSQFIIGLLMESLNIDRKNSIEVEGHRDSVSTTNTTSKKPGDIIETINGNSKFVYEVTTKKFSDDRLIESHEAATTYDNLLKDIFVICRPQDVPDSLTINESYLMATTQYKELAYYFINIYFYIQSYVLLLSHTGRSYFYQQLITYVNETNTSERVKQYFKQWHLDNTV